ncbi:nucleotidyltransferase family protein [Fretibacter rubidus]|uniref:nucleotidyltransferase family protein n=1 Tax=Fretibacter rubidus TaxID=570162 RepID=UPI00352AADE7
MDKVANVLILAGQREGVVDPLCAQAGIDRKALLPFNGMPMIDYVLAALRRATVADAFYVSGFDASYHSDLIQSPSKPGPAGSAMAAIEAGIDVPLLITTADHPLLTAEMIDIFITGAKKTGADFCVGLAEKNVIAPAYPNMKRTYLKFSDIAVSGCNLFYVANENGIEAIRFWQQAQNDRKKPWKLAWRLGLGGLLKYVSGRLSFDDAFSQVSKTLGITARPVLIPIAEAAIDVDKPSDKTLVEAILLARKQAKAVS